MTPTYPYHYYYYTIEAGEIDRTYTIEFSHDRKEEVDEILQKTLKFVEEAFNFLFQESVEVNTMINGYVKAKHQPSLRSADYLKRGAQLVTLGDSENDRFTNESNIREIEKLSSILKSPYQIKLKHEDSTDSWENNTYLGLKQTKGTILIQGFERSKNEALFNLEIDQTSKDFLHKINSQTFRMTSFEEYLSLSKV